MRPEDLANIFKNASENIEQMAEQTVNENAEDLLSLSVDLAPLDEGGLRESGSVDPAKKKGNNIEARVGYAKEYALHMHEDYYNPTTPGTGRKYLEKPTRENGKKYAERIGEKVGDAFE